MRLAVGDGLCASLRISRKPRTILFNSAVMACSVFVTVWTLRTGFGSIVELPRAGYTGGFIGAIWVMALTQYAVNSGLVAAEKSLKREQPFWKTWRTFISGPHLHRRSHAGIIAKLIGTFGFYAVTLTAPIVAIIYLTYRTYQGILTPLKLKRHKPSGISQELNHYLIELKRAEEERDRLLDRERGARAEARPPPDQGRVPGHALTRIAHAAGFNSRLGQSCYAARSTLPHQCAGFGSY